MAEYSDFESTNPLKESLRESEALEKILLVWASECHNNFGVADKDDSANWLKTILFQYINDRIILKPEKLSTLLPLDSDEYNPRNIRRGYISWLVTIFQRFHAAPGGFLDAKAKKEEISL
ncbi:MAG: hypothetical protein Q9187_006822, partial [Circinaria calcarea]